MTKAERLLLAERLIEESRRIGETIRDVTPKEGHLSLTWFPDGHVDVVISDGQTPPGFIVDAWQCSEKGRVNFGHE